MLLPIPVTSDCVNALINEAKKEDTPTLVVYGAKSWVLAAYVCVLAFQNKTYKLSRAMQHPEPFTALKPTKIYYAYSMPLSPDLKLMDLNRDIVPVNVAMSNETLLELVTPKLDALVAKAKADTLLGVV